jgi:hypothetical protein
MQIDDKQVLDILLETRDLVTTMNGKLDTVCTHDTDHEERIRKLEEKPARRWDSLVMGFLGALAVWVVSLFTKK